MGSYVPTTAAEREEMLAAIGVDSLEGLYKAVPQEMLLRSGGLNIPEGLSELEVREAVTAMAEKNKVFKTVLRGAGAYRHFIPSVVKSVTSREELVTCYTPYQAEISQGVLQGTFEFQTMICELTGMDVSNASHYDGATAAAETIPMCKDRKRTKAYVSACAHPQVIEVMKTYCFASNTELHVVPAKDGHLYHVDAEGEYWAATVFIDDTVAYNKADSPELARKGGEGIGKFQAQLADFTEPLAETIKGFHNIRHRFVQWDEALRRDAAGRVKDLAEEIGWIESRRDEMLSFWSKVEDGTIPTRVTHNDTKINNILFNKQGEVLCAIDLDTVMNSTSLNDFGDAIRSYANTGDEDDRDLSRVGMSLEMFRAYTEGYLSQRAGQLNQAEIDHLAFSARYITFEQVLRFLMDYIDGDTYYKTKYPEHNLVRTRAQYKLLQSMEEQYGTMCEIVRETVAKYK